MKRRMVIVVPEQTTAPQRLKVTNALKSFNVSWWHWIGNVWLITGTDLADVVEWRERMRRASPNLQVLVMEADTDFAAFLPKEWLPWLEDHWDD